MSVLNDCVQALRLQEDLGLNFYHICRSSVVRLKNGEWGLIALEDAQQPHPLYSYQDEFNSQLLGKNYYISPQLLTNTKDNSYYNVTVSDQLFSLACTVLSLCLMK